MKIDGTESVGHNGYVMVPVSLRPAHVGLRCCCFFSPSLSFSLSFPHCPLSAWAELIPGLLQLAYAPALMGRTCHWLVPVFPGQLFKVVAQSSSSLERWTPGVHEAPASLQVVFVIASVQVPWTCSCFLPWIPVRLHGLECESRRREWQKRSECRLRRVSQRTEWTSYHWRFVCLDFLPPWSPGPPPVTCKYIIQETG